VLDLGLVPEQFIRDDPSVMNPIHKSSIEPNKARGKIWVRICTPTDFLHECAVDELDEVDIGFAIRTTWPETSPLGPKYLTLCYCYSGTTGECLQTITTLVENGQPISLSSVGFVPIDHQPGTAPRVSNETFSSQWTTIGDQRFLIEVTNGGFPSTHENSIARTICQFTRRFQVPVYLLRIQSQSGPSAHPLESRNAVVDTATVLSNSPRSVARLEQLNEALQLLYDRQVHCRVNVYPDPKPADGPLLPYLQRCFWYREPPLTSTTLLERTRFVL